MPAGTNPTKCETVGFVPTVTATVAEPDVAIAGDAANGVRQDWHAVAGAGVSVPQRAHTIRGTQDR